MTWLVVKNFTRLQHYKDRNPPWIKLYTSILTDYEFVRLPDITKGHLILLWVLASRSDGILPDDVPYLQRAIGADEVPDVTRLVEAGFLTRSEVRVGPGERWPSRYVPKDVKEDVFVASGGQCAVCGATENLEVDHIQPISKGGESTRENLQILCRPCNRRKRSVSAEQFATQIPRERREEKTEKNNLIPPAREAWLERFGAIDRRTVTAFLDSLPNHQALVWEARIAGYLKGMDMPSGKIAAPAAIATALRDLPDGELNPARFRRYVERAMVDAANPILPKPPRENPNGKSLVERMAAAEAKHATR